MDAQTQSTYTQDVEFTSGFGAMQTPTHMFTVAAVNDVAAPAIDKPFRYLDMACGNGLTLAMLADSYPHAEFVGIDLNPDHIDRANRRATEGGLTNINYHVGDLAALSGADYGAFDYVAAAGVYSWLDAPRRLALRRFFSDALKPGGLAFLLYSSQPGMTQIAALYRFLREIGEVFSGSSAEKLKSAALYAEELRKGKVGFFHSNPLAIARLRTIISSEAESEAHEVFNLQENGFWSIDVLRDMRAEDLSFVGSASLHHNLPKLVSRPDTTVGGKVLPLELRQMQFDIAWNTGVRRDIFIKGEAAAYQRTLRDSLVDQYVFCNAGALSDAHRARLKKPFQNFDFCASDAAQFAEAAGSATRFGELYDRLENSGMSVAKAVSLTKHFLAARIISVGTGAPGAGDHDGDVVMSSQLNQMMLHEQIGMQGGRPFSSTTVGTRVVLPLKDRIYLWALTRGDLSEAWDRLGPLQSLFKDQNKPITKHQFTNAITDSLPSFRQHAVPELLRMRVVKPTT
ncbi:MAG: hypothetical protein Hens3KO_23660 [Henriciella sp.]